VEIPVLLVTVGVMVLLQCWLLIILSYWWSVSK